MTLPNERINAIKRTREFLRDLLNPKKTPKVPKCIRQQASDCLKHYPWDMYLNDVFNNTHKQEKLRSNKKRSK